MNDFETLKAEYDKRCIEILELKAELTAWREAGRVVPQQAIDRLIHEIDVAERTLEANIIDLM